MHFQFILFDLIFGGGVEGGIDKYEHLEERHLLTHTYHVLEIKAIFPHHSELNSKYNIPIAFFSKKTLNTISS